MSDDLILVQNLIHEIRGKKVMLDFDLERFPEDFMFSLSQEEFNSLIINIRSQFVTLEIPGQARNEAGMAGPSTSSGTGH